MSKVSRRKFLRGLGLAAAGTAAAACQPQTVVVEKEITKEVEKVVEKVVKETVVVEKLQPVEIDMWGWPGPIWDAMAAEYMEQNPHVTVNISEGGDMVFGDQKFMTAVAAGKGPDVSIQNRHTFMQFSAKGLYMDITPYMDDEGIAITDFAPVQMEETMWDGKVYGIPWYTDVRPLYWNRKHFEEAGLDPDTPPTDWAELESFAEKLNVEDGSGNLDRIGFVPYLVGNTWMWLYGFLNKAPSISADKRTILCDDPRWADALEWMVGFYDKYIGSFEIAQGFSQAVSASGLGDPFAAEKVSMVGHVDGAIGSFVRNPDLEWDVAPMPIPPGGEKSTWSCGWSFVLPPSAKYPDVAWDLVRWWTGLEGWEAQARAEVADIKMAWEREKIEGEALYWPQDPVYLPAQKMLEEKYISQLPDVMQKAWGISMDALDNWTHGCGTEMGVAALEYWVEMDNATRSALSHKMSPAEAMEQCQQKVQEATDRAWEAIDSQ
jgi:multiple sugar transport system substrate-binding protein